MTKKDDKTNSQKLTLRQRCSGSQRYSVILSTRMQPMVRTASARISGLPSWESCDEQGCCRRGQRNLEAGLRAWCAPPARRWGGSRPGSPAVRKGEAEQAGAEQFRQDSSQGQQKCRERISGLSPWKYCNQQGVASKATVVEFWAAAGLSAGQRLPSWGSASSIFRWRIGGGWSRLNEL